VTALAFAPAGGKLVSASLDHSARLWSVPAGEALFALRGQASGVNALALSSDGRQAATGNTDRSVKL